MIAILLIALLVKLPTFRMHAWLPKAHVEGSMLARVMLAGVLLKLPM